MSRPITDLGRTDLRSWDAFVVSHPFGRCRATSVADLWWNRTSHVLHRLAALNEGQVEAGLALAIKRMPLVPWTVARIVALMPGGQNVGNSTAALLAAAESIARRLRSLEIVFDCWMPLDFELGDIRYAEPVMQALQKAGYASVGPSRGTYLVRIDKEDEPLLASFSSKARRDARKGLREGVTVRRLDAREHLKFFADTHEEMRHRKGQIQLDEFPFETSLPLFERGYFRLFGAEYQGNLCNMALTDALGVPQYVRGATSGAAFESGVPPTGQTLHYEIMKHFRQQGGTYYDLGGVPGPEPQRRHPNYTVWRFKHEFGGRYVELMPRYQLSLGIFGKMAMAAARHLLGKRG